jgi:hypothetical protein
VKEEKYDWHQVEEIDEGRVTKVPPGSLRQNLE